MLDVDRLAFLFEQNTALTVIYRIQESQPHLLIF